MYVAKIVTSWLVLTSLELTVNVADVLPALIVTVAGVVVPADEVDKAKMMSVGCDLSIEIVAVDESPPMIGLGLIDKLSLNGIIGPATMALFAAQKAVMLSAENAKGTA